MKKKLIIFSLSLALIGLLYGQVIKPNIEPGIFPKILPEFYSPYLSLLREQTCYGSGAVDSGSAVPNVGETVTGATSGATGKVICMSDLGGDWGAGTGTGTIKLVSCDGRFQDNENLDGSTSGANFCTINMPNSAAGVDLVQNGDLSVDTDPPTGWDVYRIPTLTTEAGGQVGNCIMITGGDLSNPGTEQEISVTVGKSYKLSWYVKQGTESTWYTQILNVDATEYITSTTEVEATAAWVRHTLTFGAPAGCASVKIRFRMRLDAPAGITLYFDEISLYEITPCCTGADVSACETWLKSICGSL